MLRVFDMFSGIGGFSLGLERTGGFRTVAFCEIEEWGQRVLAEHWPNVPQLGDVTKIGVEPMSSAADSPVRTSALPAEAPALPASVPLSGGGYAEPFAWYDRNTQSWRTWQRCLIEGWTPFAETWPRSGMTRSGIAFRLPVLVPLTAETESGSLPTPTVMDATLTTKGKAGARGRHSVQLSHLANSGALANEDPIAEQDRLRQLGLTSAAERKWPTPTSRDYKDGSAKACANVPNNGLLGRVVHLFPTPTRSDYRSPNLNPAKNGQEEPASGHALPAVIGGSLNPTWVEWLMGYPLGWTVLKDWGTQSSRKSQSSSVEQSSTLKVPSD